jgi:hypothetical protein
VPLRGRCWKNGTQEPICLAADAKIATPSGDIRVRDLAEGMPVWTLDATGRKVAATVLRTSSVPAPAGHVMSRITLEDGRTIAASPGHPTCGPPRLGDLAQGDAFDRSRVKRADRVPYGGAQTFDLLPDGDTGCYWADGVLVGSTLH